MAILKLKRAVQPPARNRSIVQPHPLIVQLVGFKYHSFPLNFLPENRQLTLDNEEIARKSANFRVLSTKKALIIVSKLH